eukprot:1605587-Pyramimonas_sp.AAC.1
MVFECLRATDAIATDCEERKQMTHAAAMTQVMNQALRGVNARATHATSESELQVMGRGTDMT